MQGLNSTLQLSPSTAFKKSFLLNLGSKSFLCDRIEGHKIIAATRHLDLRLRSRPPQKRTTPQPQKWARFRGPKTGPQTAACGESCELSRKRRSLHKQSEIRLQNWIHLAAPFLGSPSLLHFGKNPAPRPPSCHQTSFKHGLLLSPQQSRWKHGIRRKFKGAGNHAHAPNDPRDPAQTASERRPDFGQRRHAGAELRLPARAKVTAGITREGRQTQPSPPSAPRPVSRT